MSRSIVVAVLCAVSLFSATSSSAQISEYELDEVLEMARTYAPLLAEHNARQDHAEWQQYRADRAWWPSLSAQTLVAPVPAEADPSRIDENFDEILSLNLGPYFRQTARVTMPIYTFGRISGAQELAAVGVDVAQLQRDAAIQDHLLRARQAYFGRQLARAFAELLAEGDELIKDTLQEMEEDRAFGEADFNTADLRRLQIFNAELDTMLLDNARLRDLTEAALRYLTDTDDAMEVPALRPQDADLPIGELALYQEVALENRPEVKQLEQAVQARRIQQDLSRRDFYPNLFVAFDFGFGWSTEDPALQRICRRVEQDGACVDSDTLFTRPYSNPFDTLTFGVAVGLQWKFDFAQQYGRLQESKARTVQTEAQQERALGAMKLEIEEAWRIASDARARIDIEERRYDSARRWRNQYGLSADLQGSADMREALDPLKAFYEARVGYLEASHAYLAARAELARKIGVESLDEVEILNVD